MTHDEIKALPDRLDAFMTKVEQWSEYPDEADFAAVEFAAIALRQFTAPVSDEKTRERLHELRTYGTKLTDRAADHIEAQAREIAALRARVIGLDAALAEHGGRYWEARYRDEAAENETLLSQRDALREALATTRAKGVRIEREANALQDVGASLEAKIRIKVCDEIAALAPPAQPSAPGDETKLAALDRFMVEQILNASDDEILAQAEPGDAESVNESLQKARRSISASAPCSPPVVVSPGKNAWEKEVASFRLTLPMQASAPGPMRDDLDSMMDKALWASTTPAQPSAPAPTPPGGADE